MSFSSYYIEEDNKFRNIINLYQDTNTLTSNHFNFQNSAVDKRSLTEDYNININEIRSNCNNNRDKNESYLEYNYDLNSKIEDNKGKHFDVVIKLS
jgi:hypothetical protein